MASDLIYLKPCPFCGGKADMSEYPECGVYIASVYCTGCDADMTYWGTTRDEAAKTAMAAWNRRTGDAQ